MVKRKLKPPLSVRLKRENEIALEEIKEYFKLDSTNATVNKVIEDWDFCLRWLPLASKMAGIVLEIEKVRNSSTREIFRELGDKNRFENLEKIGKSMIKRLIPGNKVILEK